MSEDPRGEEEWYRFLMEGESAPRTLRRIVGRLPSSPRCKLCNSPFRGWGGFLMHLMGRDQSRYNPRYCEQCERFEHPGGAEIVLTMMFADVRGSSTLAEEMPALEFSQLINRFYVVATDVLVRSDAFVDRLIGDEVIGLYIPGFAGPDHSRLAIQAAHSLLQLTGHHDPEGPWVPVGVGIHTGQAFVGIVGGTDGNPTDFTALGDNVNITARLAARARAGEILVSDAAYSSSGLNLEGLEHQFLELKGRSQPISVHAMHITAD